MYVAFSYGCIIVKTITLRLKWKFFLQQALKLLKKIYRNVLSTFGLNRLLPPVPIFLDRCAISPSPFSYEFVREVDST